jgi:hypothetical protein
MPYGARGAHAMLMQEDHDFADHLLIRPSGCDLGRTHRADACDLAQPLRCCLYDVEHILTEGFHQPLGINRPDASDYAGAEVFLDPVHA